MQRDRINDQWRDRWELLQLMLEVYQFARDAAVAEQWLIAQEPYLLNEDLGETLDQVEQLIKKHETNCYMNPTNLVECLCCGKPIKNFRLRITYCLILDF